MQAEGIVKRFNWLPGIDAQHVQQHLDRQVWDKLFKDVSPQDLAAKGKEKGVNFSKAHVAMSVEEPGANYGVMRHSHIACHAAAIAWQLGRKVRFDPAKEGAPRLVAKGKGVVAKRIREIAERGLASLDLIGVALAALAVAPSGVSEVVPVLDKARAAGGQVHWARDAAEANAVVARVARLTYAASTCTSAPSSRAARHSERYGSSRTASRSGSNPK